MAKLMCQKSGKKKLNSGKKGKKKRDLKDHQIPQSELPLLCSEKNDQ